MATPVGIFIGTVSATVTARSAHDLASFSCRKPLGLPPDRPEAEVRFRVAQVSSRCQESRQSGSFGHDNYPFAPAKRAIVTFPLIHAGTATIGANFFLIVIVLVKVGFVLHLYLFACSVSYRLLVSNSTRQFLRPLYLCRIRL